MANDGRVLKIVALFWAEFIRGVGAGIDVADECIDEAIGKGALNNISDNIDAFSDMNGPVFQNAMNCSFRAGQKAREIAAKTNASKITREMFRDAFDFVSVTMVRAKSMKSENAAAPPGGICIPA